MKRTLFLTLFLVLSSLGHAKEIFLKDKIHEAMPGNYLVTCQDKNVTFLHIYDKQKDFIILEEVNIPLSRAPRNVSWKAWFESGAPGHISWTQSLLNTHTGKVEAVYSFSQKGWVNTSGDTDHFIVTLLNLKFRDIPPETRKRVGLPPGYNKPDNRPLWHPKLFLEGKEERCVTFAAFKSRWPNDRTELAGKKIEIYLPEKRDPLEYPTFFPYWVEVEGKLASGRIRVIDSGISAASPKISPLYCESASQLRTK